MGKTKLLLVIVFLIAVFFRFWQLQTIPPGLWSDEAMNGNNAVEALSLKTWKVFYPENNGREGLFINIQSIFVALLGNEPWVLRLPSAIFGVLTVLGLFYLAFELFKSERVALFASFFLATSFWHVNFSRIGFRAIMAPLFLVWSFYFLLKGLRKQSGWLLAIAGILFGLGFHTYIAYRAAPLIALLPLWKFLNDRRKENLREWCFLCLIGIFIFMAFIAALPLLWYYVYHPADFFGRTTQISIFSSSSPMGSLSENIVKTFAMFTVVGDFNWRHNFAGSAELWWPLGILFLIGFVASFRAFRSFGALFLLLWFFVMLFPVVVSNEGLPHALRGIVLAPPAMILAALGLDSTMRKSRQWLEKNKISYPTKINQLHRIERELKVLLVIFFVLLPFRTFSMYFFQWASLPQVSHAFQNELTLVARHINSQPNEVKKYVLTGEVEKVDLTGSPMSLQPILFITNSFTENKRKIKNIFYLTHQEIEIIDCSSRCFIISVDQMPPELYKRLKENIKNLIPDSSNGLFILKNY